MVFIRLTRGVAEQVTSWKMIECLIHSTLQIESLKCLASEIEKLAPLKLWFLDIAGESLKTLIIKSFRFRMGLQEATPPWRLCFWFTAVSSMFKASPLPTPHWCEDFAIELPRSTRITLSLSETFVIHWSWETWIGCKRLSIVDPVQETQVEWRKN